MVQAVDRLVGRIRAAVGPNTYVVLTSDNGYHLGQLRLNGGKGTPYDFDTHVPLVVDGPGVSPGPRRQLVSEIDLAPTFERLAGLAPPPDVSGISFARSLHRPRARGSRYVFYEHTFGLSQPGEVDDDTALGGDLSQIPSYIGVRGRRGLLVRLDLDDSWAGHRYAWELYRYGAGFEKTNVFARDHDQPWARRLMRHLRAWDDCAPGAVPGDATLSQAERWARALRPARSAVRRMMSVSVSNSSGGMSWPIPSMTSSSAPGMARAVARPPETCTILSAVPCTTAAGILNEARDLDRLGWFRIAAIWRSTPLADTPRSKVSSARSRILSSCLG